MIPVAAAISVEVRVPVSVTLENVGLEVPINACPEMDGFGICEDAAPGRSMASSARRRARSPVLALRGASGVRQPGGDRQDVALRRPAASCRPTPARRCHG